LSDEVSLTVEDLKRYIKVNMWRKSTGFFEFMDRLVIAYLGRGVLDAFFSEPRKVYEALLNYYGDEETASFVFKYQLILPVAMKIDGVDIVDELYELALNDPEEFIRRLKEFGVKGL